MFHLYSKISSLISFQVDSKVFRIARTALYAEISIQPIAP